MNKESEPFHGLWMVIVTFFMAFCFTGLVLPEFMQNMRPLWVPMVLIYWVIALPYRLGVYSAAFIGILLDIFLGAPLGQHALALAVVGYLAYLLHLRIRLIPIWQQCITIFLLSGVYQVITRVIEGVVGQVEIGFAYYQPTLISALIWPWVYVTLRFIRRQFQIY